MFRISALRVLGFEPSFSAGLRLSGFWGQGSNIWELVLEVCDVRRTSSSRAQGAACRVYRKGPY